MITYYYYYISYSLCHRLKSVHAKVVIYNMYEKKIFWEIKISLCFFVIETTHNHFEDEILRSFCWFCMHSFCSHNWAKSFEHSIVNENCVNIFIFINHLVIIFIFLLMFNKRRKFCVLTINSMFSRVRLWLKQKNITCFNVCLNQSQKHAEMTMMNTRRWNKYFVNSIRFVRICVIKLLSNLNKLLWSFKRFLKIWNDNAT